MLGLLRPEEQGPVKGEVEALAKRSRFSRFLPYLAYDRDQQCYYNSDDTVGLLWECRPLAFLSGKAADTIAGLISQEFPENTVMQFILYPDDHIDDQLEQFQKMKTRPDEVIQRAAKKYADHLSKGRAGVEEMRGIRVRNFRLFCAVKSPHQLEPERVAMIRESLSQAGLAPIELEPEKLLAWMRRLFNNHVAEADAGYDEAAYIRNQIINAETEIRPEGDHLRIGDRYAACLTPKSTPPQVDTLAINRIIGGFNGRDDDANQLNQRFIWTTTIFFRVRGGDIKNKANVMMAQRAGGSIAKQIRRRVEELDWVLDDMEQTPYVNVMTAMWVFGDDQKELDQGIARARNLWEKQQFVMQRETWIAQAMFLVALPFGLYLDKNNITTLDRDFQMSAKAASRMLPLQGDFAGNMAPVLMYIGRKGQLVTMDVFDHAANNHNFLVCAASGAGKSFQTNFLVQNYYATGSLIRIIDIGYSYEKQSMLAGGRFVDVGEQAKDLVLNPFTSLGEGSDQNQDLKTTAEIILTMIFSSTGTAQLTETQNTLAKEAVRFAYQRDGGEYGIDHVAEYLRTYPKFAEGSELEQFRDTAHEMAFNLRDFTTAGNYGSLFNGKSTLDISSDEFVVLELEQLLNDGELFQVVAMQVINAITQDLYLSDRSSQRFMLFDEAWKYFGSAPMIANIIEEGYRRARKYHGSTGIITQSALDLLKFGAAGEVVKNNSAFKFFLESEDYAQAVSKGVLEYEGLLLELAKTVKNNRPRYSEVLFDTPYGAGVGRLCVDPWTYWMNTSTGSEVAQFKKLLAQGLSADQAIDQLAAG